ncbi:YhjD/YihY/BrkB family envelope integrity protein [Nocardioides sp. P5_C9_2]
MSSEPQGSRLHVAEPASPPDPTRQLIDAASGHLPPRLGGWVEHAVSRWPGRILTASTTSFARIELFDRSMTIAAQFFTSIFPILLMAATWMGPDSASLGEATGMPARAQDVLDQAINGSESASFGVVGVLFVLVSATSLSRALTRAFAAIWFLPRPTTTLGSAWRWFAALVALALAITVTLTLTRRLAEQPPRGLWAMVLSLVVSLALGVFVPWVLLSRRVGVRLLLPGAVLVAVVMAFVRPASAVWIPRALESSAGRYGSIGVAFTYLACLYALAFIWLVTAVVGQVIATDEGTFGRWVRGETDAGASTAPGAGRSPVTERSG